MKRKIITVLLIAAMATTGLAACKSGNENASSSSSASSSASSASSASSSSASSQSAATVEPIDDLEIVEDAKLEDCITLGDYKGMEIEKAVTTITDDDVDSGVKSKLQATTIKEGACEEGDTVTVAYVGKIDGEEFDGGTSTGSQITLGSSGYIDGFDDGVVGMTLGESKDLDLTFPEDYQSEDLAGKAVVFTVTLNAIKRPFTELTEDYVKEYTSYDSIEAFKEGVKEELKATAESNDDSTFQTTVWTQLYNSTTVKQYLKADIDAAKEQYESMMTSYASMSGLELEEYIEQAGLTEEQYQIEAENYAKNMAKSTMLARLIAEKEGFETGDDDYKKLFSEAAEEYGMDEETFVSQYGQESIDEYILNKRVMNFIISEAKIKEVETTPEPTEAATETESSSTSE